MVKRILILVIEDSERQLARLKNDINVLVDIARESVSSGKNEHYAHKFDLYNLLNAGAVVVSQNQDKGGDYITQLVYKGYLFVNLSSKKLELRREYRWN